MNRIVVILGLIGSCWGGLDFGGLGHYGGGGLSLGEISLDHGYDLLGSGLGSGGHSFNNIDTHIGSYGGGDYGGGGYGGGGYGHGAQIIPVVKSIGVPTLQKVPFHVPHPVVNSIPQPYPVAVPVPRPVPYEVVKPVITKVEKKVPTPVEKIIPFKVEKHVPFPVYKHIPIPVVKPVPIKIPVYKTVVHRVKGH